jgi:hypothetical protein
LIRGVTVIVAARVSAPVYRAVNWGILPVPLAGRPMAGWLFVHLNVALEAGELKLIAATLSPAQATLFSIGLTLDWLTVMRMGSVYFVVQSSLTDRR